MKIVGAFLFLGISVCAVADTSAGLAALQNHDYATAVREFKTGVDRGEAEAQVNLGVMYARGLGVEKDIAEAWRLFLAPVGRSPGKRSGAVPARIAVRAGLGRPAGLCSGVAMVSARCRSGRYAGGKQHRRFV